MRSATKKRTGKDKAYLAWLHGTACSIPSRMYPGSCCGTPIEAAHFGPRGLSQKVPDRQAVPLCKAHHEQLHRLGPKKFWLLHGLDPEAIIKELNDRYDAGERAE